VLFLLITSFYIRIIISSLLAAHWISIIVIIYNFSVPSCLIAFDILASRQYAIAGYRNIRLPIVIYLIRAVLFI
jgi:hypothetical protein